MGNGGGKSHEAEEFSTTADAVHWQIWWKAIQDK